MKVKKLAALLIGTVTLAAMVSGCGAVSLDGEKKSSAAAATTAAGAAASTAAGAAATTAGAAQAAGSIGLSVSTMNNPFFVSLAEGAKGAAAENKVELITVDARDDAAKQASDIEDLISKNVKVLIVNPVDSDAVAPSVKDAVAAGIRVISVDRVVNGVTVDCQIASDNVAGAKMATEYLEKLIGKGSKVAEIQGTPGASAAIDRGKGFHEIADQNLKVAASQSADFNRAKALTVMENILQADSSISGVFAANDEMALGAAEAVASSGKDIKIVGFDATDDGISAIVAGKMAATIAQQPGVMGKTAVETAIKLTAGGTVEKSIPVEVQLVTSENVKDFKK